MASSIVLLANGKVAAVAPTADIMHRLDLVPLTGRAEAGASIEAIVVRHDEPFGLTELQSRAGSWRLPRLDAPLGARLRLALDVMLAKSPPADLSALNILTGKILTGIVADIGATDGPVVEIKLDCNADALIVRFTRYSVERLGLVAGSVVHALVKSVALDRRTLSGPIQPAPGADAEANDA